jgi:hypothetical protein
LCQDRRYGPRHASRHRRGKGGLLELKLDRPPPRELQLLAGREHGRTMTLN